MTIVRNVTFQIKPGKGSDFNKTITQDVLPMLKQQPGFKQELAMVNGSAGAAVSVWADKPSAEKYASSVYPEVVKKLAPVLDGTPKVEHYELTASAIGG